jgi:hypothetical protein
LSDSIKTCRENGSLDRLADQIGWNDREFWAELRVNGHHDEQAALLCAATAACAWNGHFTAVGEPEGGYFFLPPWPLWESWAKDAIRASRESVEPALDIWIGQQRSGRDRVLP